jgi:hypothetical protein
VPNGVFEQKLQRPTAQPTEPGETSTPKLAVSAVLIPRSPLRIVGVTGDSVHLACKIQKLKSVLMHGITEILTYLKNNIFLDDNASADWIAYLAKRYTLVEGDLYQRGANGILMWCITREVGCELLAEVHGGKCRSHTSSRMLDGKAFWHDFYCPIAIAL